MGEGWVEENEAVGMRCCALEVGGWVGGWEGPIYTYLSFGGRGDVQHRRSIEEPKRPEHAGNLLKRHERPVLQTRHVVGAEHVPQDEVLVHQGSVG